MIRGSFRLCLFCFIHLILMKMPPYSILQVRVIAVNALNEQSWITREGGSVFLGFMWSY